MNFSEEDSDIADFVRWSDAGLGLEVSLFVDVRVKKTLIDWNDTARFYKSHLKY